MDRSTLNRKSFHHNFLREIYIRLDFEGILESDVSPIIMSVRKDLFHDGYIKCYAAPTQRLVQNGFTESEINRANEDASGGRRFISYKFINPSNATSITLNNASLTLQINKTKYVDFTERMEPFYKILNTIKAASSYFKENKLSITKVNLLFINANESLSKYMSEKYFGFINEAYDNIGCLRNDIFKDGGYMCNVDRKVERGKLNTIAYYRVTMQSSVSTDNDEILSKLSSGSILFGEMNDILFKIYCDSLSDEFAARLTSEQFADDKLYGISEN